ncbi:DUF5017 domain-containing protein [Mariniphaga sediminis]|nr:DUF5017 domain-containing protein [Mariniphaga sediminis]
MKLKYYVLLVALFIMASCNDEIVILDNPDFDVTTDSLTYKVGDAVAFHITGNAHIISFYSGETLKDYEYHGGRVIDLTGSGATISFKSSVQYGTQENQVSVLASNNFNGDYSSLSAVKEATWTDITSTLILGTNATLVSSGTVDISDLAIPGKPVYIAIKYMTKPQAENGLVKQWFIQEFTINSKKNLENNAGTSPITLTLANQNSMGFQIVDENAENAPARSVVTTNQLTLFGNEYLHEGLEIYNPDNPIYDPNSPIFDPKSDQFDPFARPKAYVPFDPSSPFNDPISEHWAVSGGIDIEKVNLGPDYSTPVKVGIAAAPVELFEYTFKKAGTFDVVFVASNNSIDTTKEVVKKITLTITE